MSTLTSTALRAAIDEVQLEILAALDALRQGESGSGLRLTNAITRLALAAEVGAGFIEQVEAERRPGSSIH